MVREYSSGYVPRTRTFRSSGHPFLEDLVKKFLFTAGVLCVVLYWILSWTFDFVQGESRAGVERMEETINVTE